MNLLNTTWTLTAEERATERAKLLLEEPVFTGGSSSSGTTGGVTEASPTSVKARVENIEKSVGLRRRKIRLYQGQNPNMYSLVTPNGKELATVSSEDIRIQTNPKEHGQKSGEVLPTRREIS